MALSNRKILFRADADAEIGAGHVMRCIALAQGWIASGGEAVFACRQLTENIRGRVEAEGFDYFEVKEIPGSREDAVFTARTAESLQCRGGVLDGYHFDGEYLDVLKQNGLKIMLIDDCGREDYLPADILFNQNIYADRKLYPNAVTGRRFLLGNEYILLRKEFRQWKDWKREIPAEAKKILITMGGGDDFGTALKVVESVKTLNRSDLEIKIAAGGDNPWFESLKEEERLFPGKLTVYRNIGNMPEVMGWADMAVSAGGSTCWEEAYMGLPNLIIVLADNQKAIADHLDRKQVSQNLGEYSDLYPEEIAQAINSFISDYERRALFSANGRKLVDGLGVQRVVMELERLLTGV